MDADQVEAPSPSTDAGAARTYEVIDADPAEVCDDVIRVWGNSVGWPGRQELAFRSYYLDGEVGRAEIKLLRHVPSGQIVGTLGISPRQVRWQGREIRAGVLSHLCVVKEHRSIRPAALMIKEAVVRSKGRYDVLYAMPRTPESAALSKLMRYELTGDVRRCVRILRYGAYVKRLLPRPLAWLAGVLLDAVVAVRDGLRRRHDRVYARWVGHVDPAMAALWEATRSACAGWNAVRSEAALRWRFDRLPAMHRRYLLLHDPADNALVAWFACDDNPVDAAILLVEDFWTANGAAAADRSWVRALCHAARKLGFAAVEMRLAAPEACFAPWLSEGFVQRGQALMFVRWLDASVKHDEAGPYFITEFDDDG